MKRGSGVYTERVFGAVLEGCETSREVADFLGLDVRRVSWFLITLARQGRIRCRERHAVRFGGRGCHLYGPVAEEGEGGGERF